MSENQLKDGTKMKDCYMQIKRRKIGATAPAYVIAEMSANHAGSLENAKEIIYAAKESGADCIKVQTYTPDTMTLNCDKEYFYVQDGLWKKEHLYELYGKGCMPWEWQAELKELAEKIGIDFFSTPFDKSSVDFLEEIGIEFYKIASFELVDIPLIRYVASKGKPVIMSTGMGSLAEIEEAVEAIRMEENKNIALLKCSSAYPAVTDQMNIRTINDMKERFGVPVGLSDHSFGSFGATTAVAAGASIIEKHFCISRAIKNPDAAFSMEPNEFKEMVDNIRLTEMALGNVSYGATKQEEDSLRYRRSIFASEDIRKGQAITPDNIKVIRPSYGMAPKYFDSILGKTANCDIEKGTPIQQDLFE